MLLKGHKNQLPANATATRWITGTACWRPGMLVSLGFTPSMPSNSLMLRDKGQQARTSAKLNECQVGGYLFNQHR